MGRTLQKTAIGESPFRVQLSMPATWIVIVRLLVAMVLPYCWDGPLLVLGFGF